MQVFNEYLEVGGEEMSVARIRDYLEKHHHLSVCYFDSEVWTGSDRPNLLQQAMRTIYNRDSAKRLRIAIERHRPELILVHNVFPVGSPAVYHVAHEMGVPIVQYIHNFRPFSVGATLWVGGKIREESLSGTYRHEVLNGAWQNSVIKSAIMALSLKNLHRKGWLKGVRGWIAISEFMKEKFVQAGVPSSDVHVLHHGWDADASASDSKDKGYYLLLSRLIAEKGIESMLAAWDLLRDRVGDDRCPELWVGGKGYLEDAVIEAASRNPKIRFLGFVSGEQKNELLSNCRAMLAPSEWWEPLGLVTYEAYEYGKPMLAAASGGLAETVLEGKTGYLHEPGDAESIVDVVTSLEALDAKERKRMGLNGRTWLDQKHSTSAWEVDFESIIEAVRNSVNPGYRQ